MIPPEKEAASVLALVGGDVHQAFQVIERQHGVVTLRTQVLLSLCGLVITVTGFSGRAVAQQSDLARYSMTAGLFIVLAAAVVSLVGVLKVTWLTEALGDDPRGAIERAIRLRNRKTRFLAVSVVLFVLGFTLYCMAVAQLLLAQRPG
jgi:hypothetical protein